MHPVVDTRFPNPPGRSERKYRLSSSFDMVGVWSWHRELMGASRCTGSDHSELAKDMAWIPRTRSLLVSVLQAASKARRSEEHTSELQSRLHLVCRLLLEKKKYQRACTIPSYRGMLP